MLEEVIVRIKGLTGNKGIQFSSRKLLKKRDDE